MTLSTVDGGNLAGIASGEVQIVSEAVPGGTLYVSAVRQVGGVGLAGVASSFVPSSAAGAVRFVSLTNAKADTGVAITGTATGGAMGISRTAGTSMYLLGEATSGSAKTDKAFFEMNLPDSYVSGANIPVTVYAAILGTGTLTAASCTMTVAAYSEINGVEAALTVSNAQTIVAVGTPYTFTITGTGLVTGQHIGLELVGLVTSSSGANTLEVGSISFTA